MAGDVTPLKQAEQMNRILALESACAMCCSSSSPSTLQLIILGVVFVPLVPLPSLAEHAANSRTMAHTPFLLC